MADPTPARRWALAVTTRGGDEVRVSLHPISLLMILAEGIEDGTTNLCRRRGHQDVGEGYCSRCGVCLPDDSPDRSRLAEVYRTIKEAPRG